MSNYNWCHGPSCHTQETQSRVRGSKGNKVLRTIKIKANRYGNYQTGIWNHFCNNRCLMDYIETHIQSIVAIAPRREALETKIKDPTKETTTHSWGSYSNWNIEKKVS
tara:strand:- start:238 stop:561 length:324 start_codon:yes stop_codon:yes gene_type:complete